ncbi:MAG: iron-sulfur cluster-binding protein [Bacteroidales bacterium]|nr:iron-sulfur cluster-binding protein [Bacteroidales bacterium]
MSEVLKEFTKKAQKKAFDKDHRKIIKFNISRYNDAVIKGKKQYINLNLARKRAEALKQKAINELDDYLIEFEGKFTQRGGKVIWAPEAKDAIKEILSILKKHRAKNVVKSKSMTTEEIEFNEALKKKKIDSLETDLGEYIVQIADEKPYHIVTPAMHKSKENIAELFNEKFGTDINSTPEELTAFVRDLLREKFTEADVDVTGANFIISDIGAIGLTENEGNGLMSVSFPKVHIVIVGIEKVIPSLEDLDLFLPLLATNGTGQNITVYNSIISGPKQENEVDGPEEMYVILLDNNRTELLKHKIQRVALNCIRCGACLNACPVYKNIGGHTFGTTYSGPIGSVISPFLCGVRDYKHLSFASSLCGKCSDVCPVRIPLHELLLYNRNYFVRNKHTNGFERLSMYGYKKVMKKRSLLDMSSGGMKNFFMKTFMKKIWGPRRELPHIQAKSFNKLWKEKKELK